MAGIKRKRRTNLKREQERVGELNDGIAHIPGVKATGKPRKGDQGSDEHVQQWEPQRKGKEAE